MFLLPDQFGRPEQPALTDAATGHRWTWPQLLSSVEALAASLTASPKQLSFLLCRNDAATVIAYLAAIEARHAVALLSADLSPEFQQKLIALYEPDLLISSVNLDPAQGGYDLSTVGERPTLHLARRRATPRCEIHPDLALLLSTSGST